MRGEKTIRFLSGTYARFMLAYLLFFLCLASMIFPIYLSVNRLYRQAITQESQARLESSADALANEIQRMEAFMHTFHSSIAYRTLSGKAQLTAARDIYQLEVVRRELEQTFAHQAMTSPMLVEAGIIFHTDLVVTLNRSFPAIDQYYGHFLRCEDMSQRQWLAELQAAAEHTHFVPARSYLRYRDGAMQGLVIVLPIQSTYRDRTTDLLFYLLDAQSVLDAMATPDVLRTGVVTLYDRDGTVLANRGQMQGKGTTLSYTSPQAGLSVSLFVPDQLVVERISPLHQVFTIGSLLYGLGGLILTLCFSWYNHKPVKRLVSTLHAYEKNPAPSSTRREGYDAISESITRLGIDLQTAHHALAEQEQSLAAGLLARLIHGLIDTQKDWSRAMDMLAPFPEDYCVLYIQHKADPIGAVRMALMERVRQQLGQQTRLYMVESQCMLALLPIEPPRQTTAEDYAPLLQTLLDALNAQDIPVCMGLSAVFSSIQTFHIACRQARHLLRLTMDPPCMTLYANVDERTVGLPMQFTDSQQLCSILCAGDDINALLLVDSAFQRIKQRGLVDEPYLQHAFVGFLQVFDRVYFDLQHLPHALPPDLPDLPVYDQTQSLYAMHQEVRRVCLAICAHVKKEQQQLVDRRFYAVLRYIQENMADPSLYAQSVATAFDMAERSLHRLMREHTGKSFFEYVEDLRMDQAHTLLCNTDLAITDIAAQCGFALSNSFYKAFKRRYGLAPSAMRRDMGATAGE